MEKLERMFEEMEQMKSQISMMMEQSNKDASQTHQKTHELSRQYYVAEGEDEAKFEAQLNELTKEYWKQIDTACALEWAMNCLSDTMRYIKDAIKSSKYGREYDV